MTLDRWGRPTGYYPDDAIAQRYQWRAPEGHTYAQHLMMEQALKYLKPSRELLILFSSK